MLLKRLLPLLGSLALMAGPSETPIPATPKGCLVIAGGGALPAELIETFLKASGGRGGVVGIIPTASSVPAQALKGWKDTLAKAGLEMVALDVRKREEASQSSLLEAARRCTGFWFSGGDQNLVGDKIVGTPLHALIRDRYRAGACVGGTSAGAAVMSRLMLTGDDRQGKNAWEELGPGAYRTREGLGLLPDRIIVDQHFVRRNRQNRLLSLVMEHPDHLGFGIDESTALVVRGEEARVVGEGGVLVYDPTALCRAGEGFLDLKVHFLRRGQGLDLASRKPLP